MTGSALITLKFLNYWLAGTGGGQGRNADIRCHRDRDGFPAMPMSQIKGILRETADRMVKARELTFADRDNLFGGRPPVGSTGAPSPASLEFVGEAQLGTKWTGSKDALFSMIASTSIGEGGVAKDRTLRMIEVAKPCTLIGKVTVRVGAVPPKDWVTLLDTICAATLAFGKGKPDGLGQAIATATLAKQTAAVAPKPPRAKAAKPILLDLILTQSDPAVFSSRSATQGAHQTLAAPTGSSLLGWAATAGPYEKFGTTAFDVFHSGKVRFLDAQPDSGAYGDVIPIPASLAAPKGTDAEIAGDLVIDLIRNGKPASAGDIKTSADVQYEALPVGMMTLAYQRSEAARGQRLRTATLDGRAAKGQLFGVQHLEPGHQMRFRARIEIDANLPQAAIDRLIAAFHGRSLRLGRGKSTGYGGGFDCQVTLAQGSPAKVGTGRQGRIAVLALSNLALLDDWGAPDLAPAGAVFGLAGGIFLPGASAINLHRFAPWNATLGCRDTERLLIAAGSVLVFDLGQDVPPGTPSRQTVGLWREAGLGRVWIDPPMLRDWRLPATVPLIALAASGQQQRGRTR